MLGFDIETVPTEKAMAADYPDADRNPPGNYSKPEAIEKWREADRIKWAAERAKECALNPRLGRIVAIGYGAPVGVCGLAKTEAEEADLLREFWGVLFTSGQLGGFNSHSFDFPFLLTRSLVLGVQIPVDVTPYLRRYSYTPHFDARMALTGWDSRASGTLSDWCQAFGIAPPVGKGSEVYDAYLQQDWDTIVTHCRSDVQATERLVDRVAPAFGI